MPNRPVCATLSVDRCLWPSTISSSAISRLPGGNPCSSGSIAAYPGRSGWSISAATKGAGSGISGRATIPRPSCAASRLRLAGANGSSILALSPLLVRARPRTALITASLKDPTAWMALLLCRVLGDKNRPALRYLAGPGPGDQRMQRTARRIVYNRLGDAFVGASRQTLKMFQFYNPRLGPERLFLSHLVADNEAFLAGWPAVRSNDDLMSCSQDASPPRRTLSSSPIPVPLSRPASVTAAP